MPITTWNALKELTASRKIVVLKLVPKEHLLKSWTLEASSTNDVYKCTLTNYYNTDLDNLYIDGSVMTRGSSAADLETGAIDRYYYDVANTTLYINVASGDTPYGYVYIAHHLLYFSNNHLFVELITDGNCEIMPESRIDSIPSIKHSTSGVMAGLTLPSAGNIKINNIDGALDSIYKKYIWVDTAAYLYIGGESLPFSEYQLLFRGYVSDNIKWDRDSIDIKIKDYREKLFQKNPLTKTWGVTVDPRVKDKPLPKIYGKKVKRVQGYFSNNHTLLDGDIDNSQTTINVAPYTALPTAGRIIIDDEKISFTGRTLGQLTGCTRGYDGTDADSHSDGANVILFYASGASHLQYKPFDDCDSIDAAYHENERDTDNNITGAPVVNYNASYSSKEIEDVTKVSIDVSNSAGDALGSMLKTILNDAGIADADLDTSSFTDLDADVTDSIAGAFMASDDDIDDIIDLMLLTSLAYLNVDTDGKLAVKQWNPTTSGSNVYEIEEHEIADNWKQDYDLKNAKRKINVLYDKKYTADGDDEYLTIEKENLYIDILPIEDEVETFETCEYSPTYADRLATLLSYMTMNQRENVGLTLLPLKYITLRPGDRIIISFDRPWGYDYKYYEIEKVEIKIGSGGVNIDIDCHDVYGLQDRYGVYTGTPEDAWTDASGIDKVVNGFYSDGNGFIDPSDESTLNRKVYY